MIDIAAKSAFRKSYKTQVFKAFTVILITALMAGITTADEFHFARTGPAPETKWQPTADVLKEALKTTLMPADVITNIHKGVTMCVDYIKANPDDIEGKIDAYAIMAQSYFNLGEYQTSEDDRMKSYTAGKDAAQKVIDLAPDRWEGWAWYAINLGYISQLKGVFRSLFLLEPFKKHIFKAEKLAPNNSFVLDAIGDMYRQLPWIAGGSLKKSKEYLEKAIKADPHATFVKFDLAITLLQDDKKEQAKELLTEVVNEKNPSWAAHWQIWEKPKAEALLNDMDTYEKLLDKWHMLT
jgi:tetratricopeptide (TPR) repeat protein